MHYYEHNIGDYRRDTSHLTLLEHGIYRSLLDTCYLSEQPLCADLKKLMRTHSIRSEDEKEALENILQDFFELTEDGYIHHGCVKRISKLYEKSEKARRSAKARWERKKCKENANASENNANASETYPECSEKPMQTDATQQPNNPTTQQPNKTYSSKSKISPCPHQKIIEIYHKVLPDLPGVVVKLWDKSNRSKHLAARWKESEEHQNLEFWEWYFSSVKKHPFYLGQNGRCWKADLGWLVKSENFVKLVEKFLND